jgi:hypothetical protein
MGGYLLFILHFSRPYKQLVYRFWGIACFKHRAERAIAAAPGSLGIIFLKWRLIVASALETETR